MKPPPRDWPRISSSLFYKDASKAIAWLCEAFGFEVRIKVEAGGHVQHSELTYGDGVVMVGEEGAGHDKGRTWMASPASLGGKCTQGLFLYVDDLDAHCARARAAGATITSEPVVTDHGADYWADYSYGCTDLEGHHWWFSQRMRSKA
jgi:uncharacterized glyoxalase superfamily protein PhnB